jgi:Flp pilus assembly protein TadB
MRKRKKNKESIIEKAIVRSGIKKDPETVKKSVFNIAVTLNVILSLYFVFNYSFVNQYPAIPTALALIGVWVVAFFVFFILSWIIFLVYLDLQRYRRTVALEEVLPDFLQLTAANLRAGMTPDRALWYSIRPQFGVLSYEIRTVAKEVMTGSPLDRALKRFSNKYDSVMLQRTVSLLVEGLNAGGDLAEILNRVGTDIQETRILRKEMAANVVTYVIFISAAVMFASPVLLALSKHLLVTLTSVTSSIDIPASAASATLFTISNVSIAPSDFQTFALIMIVFTSLFSAMMISIIQKGNVQAGLKYIPMFIGVSLFMYWIGLTVLGSFLNILVA